MVLTWGDCPRGNIWARVETFLVHTTWGEVVGAASIKWGGGQGAPHILPGTGIPPTSEDYPAPVVGSVKFKRLYFRRCIILNEFAQ